MINHNFSLNNKGYSNASESLLLPRYRWYSYKEGFSPNLVQHAIDGLDFNKEKDIIFDPFNGGGTVTLFSALSGYKSIGYEINPFSSFISKSKQVTISPKISKDFESLKDFLINKVEKGRKSPLLYFSTFSELNNEEKWLFNSSVLNAFEGGNNFIKTISNPSIRQIFKLALINSAMENCNAKKDGKCLRYKSNWEIIDYDKNTFISSLEDTLKLYFDDLKESEIKERAKLLQGDSLLMSKNELSSFKLCITSPPYLNSFDYTDVYRPELFLGEFLKNQGDFNKLKHRTLRSHISINTEKLSPKTFGTIYDKALSDINYQSDFLWNSKIPKMIQAYFEDISIVLKNLSKKAVANSQLWMIVANSAYANVEIPTDLIIGEIGAKSGWFLKEIGVLRYLNKRGSKYSPDIRNLRESVIIFSKDKF